MADQILPEGLRFFNKHQNAPDFVIGSLVVTMNDLYEFCKAHPELLTEYNGKKQLKLQVLKSAAGNLYSAVDTYKPATQAAPATAPTQAVGNNIDLPATDSLPF